MTTSKSASSSKLKTMKKKNTIWIYPLIALCFLLMFSSSCKKKDNNNNPSSTTGTVTDIDGNIYHTVTIGTQVWMVENLKVTHYRNGDPIAHIIDDTLWVHLTSGAFCNYNDDGVNGSTFGRLYNWYAIAEAHIISPVGWHVPSDAEWTTLTTYLGGESIAGGKLKEKDTIHWNTPNTGATNETGFTALPGGYRGFIDGTFYNIGSSGIWWSSTEGNASKAWDLFLNCSSSDVIRGTTWKGFGFSVRCVRDF